MAAYLTAAKQAEIVKNYHPALPKSAMQYLLTELAAAIAQAGVSEVGGTIDYDDFTDGGGTSGTYEFTPDIPAGALVIGATCTEVTGFTGDSSATVTYGDGSDVDRYNTGTPSVFATADVVDLGAISGAALHSADKTLTITVTSGSDFGLVTAGSMKVAVFYIIAD